TWEASMAEQVERAFLKQPTINLNNKARILAGNKKVPRYVRNIGLGFKTPLEKVLEYIGRSFMLMIDDQIKKG
ncbi:hypothetical protein TELCIR_19981, partial [Teladorsagia circumcincta]